MKRGVAVMLRIAAEVARQAQPRRDITFRFYECEEIDAEFNGLVRCTDANRLTPQPGGPKF